MSAALIKELRERTGLGLLECKKALSESTEILIRLLTIFGSLAG